MSSRIALAALAAAVLAAMPASCGAQAKILPSERLLIRAASGASVALEAEIAEKDADHARGLMYRKSLPEGKGMLFAFSSDRMMSFWMKNTYVPLSIAYLSSDGRILELHDMEPLSEAPVNSDRYARFALEVPQGWFARAGVAVGDRLELPERLRVR